MKDIIRSKLYEILYKYKTEELPLKLKLINDEKLNIENEINLIVKSDRAILNKYYINKVNLQVGGTIKQFNEETVKNLKKLDELFEKLGKLDSTKISENASEIQKKTEEILKVIEEINKIIPTVDVEDIRDKIPQKLETIRVYLENKEGSIKLNRELNSLYVPFQKLDNVMNSSALNKILEEFTESLNEINKNTDDNAINTLYEKLKNATESNIKKMNEDIVKMKEKNEDINKKNLEFDTSLEIKIEKNDIKTVKSIYEFLNEVKSNTTDELKKLNNELNDNITESTLEKGYFKPDSNYSLLKFINEYNEIAKTSDNLQYRYNGIDTRTISNNILKDTQSTTDSKGMMESIKKLLNINLDEFEKKDKIEEEEFKNIYNPDFKIPIKGGNDEKNGGIVEKIKSLKDEITTKTQEYRSVYLEYVKNTEKFNKYSIYDITHSLYLLSILSNSLFVKSSFQIYKYIGRGMINFYKRIIEKIYKDLKLPKSEILKKTQEEQFIIMEIRKKYFLVISRLNSFLNNISIRLNSKDIIDIDNSTEVVKNNFMILNHFKSILEKYNELQMNKLTIYSRINDIGKEFTDNNENVQFYIDNKLFISDYDRQFIYEGYYKKTNTDGNYTNPDQNTLLKKELRILPTLSESKTTTKNTVYFSNDSLKEAYTIIKDFYEKKNIEELEAYKKSKLSELINKIYTDTITLEKNIELIKNDIERLENKKEEAIEQLYDARDDEVMGENLKKDTMLNIINDTQYATDKDNNIIKENGKSINIDIYIEKLKKKLSENGEETVKNNKEDIKNILYVIKIAIEYLYATRKEVNEKLMWIRNFTCDAQKNTTACDASGLNPPYIAEADGPQVCNFSKEDIPYLNSYKFTEVFDSKNFQNNSDMSAYMCLNSRITNGNSVCVITYGYSGTGKSYTLFGRPMVDGLLQGTLNKLNGLEKIYFRLFEIYGKGLSYTDYWVDDTGKLKTNIYNYLYAYKLKKDTSRDSDKIGIDKANNSTGDEWAVKLKNEQIKDYIDKVKFTNNQPESYQAGSDILNYLEIGSDEYKDIFQSFKIFTDKIEQIRIKTKRVRETPNNRVSSRSILIYDFVLMININGEIKPVNFLIVDLPGREDIEATFINKYVDLNTNKYLYDIIKTQFISKFNEFPVEYKKILNDGKETIQEIEKDKVGEKYMKELKLLLGCISLNPVSVPVFACEIIESYFKKNYNRLKEEIIDKKIKRKYKLRGEWNNRFTGNTIIYENDMTLMDEFYEFNYNEKIFINNEKYFEFYDKRDSIENVDINIQIPLNSTTKDLKLNYTSSIDTTKKNTLSSDDIKKTYILNNIIFKCGLGWYTFKNIIEINEKGELIFKKDKHDNNINTNNDKIKIEGKVPYKKLKQDTNSEKIIDDPNINKYPYGTQSDRQIKSMFFMNFIERLIELERYDILDELFEYIIDRKINKYIKSHIESLDSNGIKTFIETLMNYNFKKEALSGKFFDKNNFKYSGDITKNITITLDDIYELKPDGYYKYNNNNLINITESKLLKEYVYESVKYDFYTTGFEGIYINENIIGLIKYLGRNDKLIKDKADRNSIKISKQEENTFEYGKKIGKMLQMSRIKEDGKILPEIDFASYSPEIQSEFIKKGLYILRNTEYVSGKSKISLYTENFIDNIIQKSELKSNIEIESSIDKGDKNPSSKIRQLNPTLWSYSNDRKMLYFDINRDKLYTQLYKKTSKTEIFIEINKQSKPESSESKKEEATMSVSEGRKIFNQPSDKQTNKQTGNNYKAKYDSIVDYYYDITALESAYAKLKESYYSDRIFSDDNPIIKSILEPYLDLIGDFKIFYLFGNYTKPTRELKCVQQYDLLETTNNFIEAITR